MSIKAKLTGREYEVKVMRQKYLLKSSFEFPTIQSQTKDSSRLEPLWNKTLWNFKLLLKLNNLLFTQIFQEKKLNYKKIQRNESTNLSLLFTFFDISEIFPYVTPEWPSFLAYSPKTYKASEFFKKVAN